MANKRAVQAEKKARGVAPVMFERTNGGQCAYDVLFSRKSAKRAAAEWGLKVSAVKRLRAQFPEFRKAEKGISR